MHQTSQLDTKQTENTHFTIHKLRMLTANINGQNNFAKRKNIFNLLKTKKKPDITLLQETHSTKTTKIQWQKE